MTFSEVQQRLASERKAYAAEVACLKAKLAKIDCGSECKKVITDRLKQIAPYVNNPPGF